MVPDSQEALQAAIQKFDRDGIKTLKLFLTVSNNPLYTALPAVQGIWLVVLLLKYLLAQQPAPAPAQAPQAQRLPESKSSMIEQLQGVSKCTYTHNQQHYD